MKPPNGRRPLLRHFQYESPIKLSPHVLSETADVSSYDPLPSGSSKFSGYPKLNCTAAAIVVVLVVTFFLLGIFSSYLRRLASRRHMPPRELPFSSSASSKGVDVAVVRSLPVYPYRCDSKVKMDCPICLTEYEEKEGVKVLPFCHHMFHPDCIDTWLFSHVSCPVCRSTRFFGEKGDVDYGEFGGRSRVRNDDTSVHVETRGVRRISI